MHIVSCITRLLNPRRVYGSQPFTWCMRWLNGLVFEASEHDGRPPSQLASIARASLLRTSLLLSIIIPATREATRHQARSFPHFTINYISSLVPSSFQFVWQTPQNESLALILTSAASNHSKPCLWEWCQFNWRCISVSIVWSGVRSHPILY